MSLPEFARLNGSDDPWVLPVARLVARAIHNASGEPNENIIDAIAQPEPTDIYFRLSDERGLIAMVALSSQSYKADPHEYELTLLAVDPARQGDGYGLYMLRQAERQAREMGATVLRIMPTGKSDDFYRNHGYADHPIQPYVVRALPKAIPPVELPQQRRAGEGDSETVDAAVVRSLDLILSVREEMLLAGGHTNDVRTHVEDIFGGSASEVVEPLLTALSIANEHHEAMQQSLQKSAEALQAYHAGITDNAS